MRRSSSLTGARLMWRHVLAAIERTVKAEAAASGAPRAPETTPRDRYPLNVNDREASTRVAHAFHRHVPPDRVWQTGPAPASEDFGSFGTEWQAPSVFWFVGGTDPDTYAKAKKAGHLNDIPVNHSPLGWRRSFIPRSRRAWKH
jgi:metal-dependent amidase/aminoacylase/carboxypeptidase family protein